jgi:hypothetical protein
MRRLTLTKSPSAPEAPVIEPGLSIDDVCQIRSVARRTGERERSAGLWPHADYFVGIGVRKRPRWFPETIRRWLEEEADRIGRRGAR